MMKSKYHSAFPALVLTGALSIPALAQTSSTQTTTAADPAAATPAAGTDSSGTYATGKPLEQQSKEGFWGHMNPLARKKWVKRQTDPIRDRTNELDELQAKNRNDIHDVDSRAQAGITKANSAAALADQHAQDASNRANTANGVATDASTRTNTLNGTVQNLDQYQQVSATTVPFAPGHLLLSKSAKSDLDDVATKLGTEKGYIIEVQGYSRSGVKASQDMADSVVRYLVTEHQVPIYRIYKSGLGKQTTAEATATDPDAKPISNGVRVTLLHNSLASMSGNTSAANRTPGVGATGTANPPAN